MCVQLRFRWQVVASGIFRTYQTVLGNVIKHQCTSCLVLAKVVQALEHKPVSSYCKKSFLIPHKATFALLLYQASQRSNGSDVRTWCVPNASTRLQFVFSFCFHSLFKNNIFVSTTSPRTSE